MAEFERPSLSALVSRIEADLATHIPGYVVGSRRSVERALSIALAGVTHGLHGHIKYLSKQILPDSAEAQYLDRFAGVYGLTRKVATKSTGNITITGTVNGTIVPAGTVWVRGDGTKYTTNVNVTIASLTATAAVTSVNYGAETLANSGVALRIETPIATIVQDAAVASGGFIGGTDEETDANFLSRLLARVQLTPRGGNAPDYVAWARETPLADATRAWATPLQYGVGTVGVAFVRDNDVGGIIPTPEEVALAQTYINARKPSTARVTVFAPTATVQNFVIAYKPYPVSDPDNDPVRIAIIAELTDLFSEFSAPNGKIYLSQIREAISVAADEVAHVLTTPSADISWDAEHIGTIGAFTWSALA